MDHQSHAEAKVTKAPESVARGSVFLSLAAVWHAISGYVIFITGYHILKPGTYGDFMLVVWTMTTLEILVVDGLPRALAQAVAREPGAVRGLTRFGMIWTLLLGTALAALLFALAPFIAGTVWKDASLTTPLRLAGLDFVAFVGFAVMVQTLNGLRQYTRQAMAWFLQHRQSGLRPRVPVDGWGRVGGDPRLRPCFPPREHLCGDSWNARNARTGRGRRVRRQSCVGPGRNPVCPAVASADGVS